ncbi:MAG: YjgN family protein, partial [bacterium]
GIYSAWAKVRKNRYFYGNTLLQDAPFEYLADPVKILIGRIIALGIFALYTATIYFQPGAVLLFWLLFLCIYPALVVRSLAFKARNTAYRNIRFDFAAKYGEAAGVLIGTGFLAGLTLGIAYPYYAFRRSQFIVDYSRYGERYFDFLGKAKNFYAVYFIAIVLGVAGIVMTGILSAIFPVLGAFDPAANEPVAAFASILLVYLWVGLFVYLPVIAYMKTAIPNLVLSNTSLGKNRLESTLRFPRMLWLYFSNAVAILCSLGLLIPWASIRLARYRFDNLALSAVNRLDSFVADEQEKVSAAGEEISDFFDFEVGI